MNKGAAPCLTVLPPAAIKTMAVSERVLSQSKSQSQHLCLMELKPAGGAIRL